MEKFVKCKKCGAEIFKGAKTCPHCGARNKKPFGVIVLIIIIILIAFFMIKNKLKNNITNNNMNNPLPDKSQSSDINSGKSSNLAKSDKKDTNFKEWVDAYESFMNEYYDFLDDYAKDSTGLTDKYSDYMTKYAELLQAANDLDEKDYSTEDWAYYNKALIRIMERASKQADDKTKNSSSEKKEKKSKIKKAESDNKAKDSTSKIDKKDEKTKASKSDNKNVSFREWVDAYENFMNEYYDFLGDYAKDPIGLASKYSDYMAKYAEFLQATNDLNEDDYTLADWAYYMKAAGRILKKASKAIK